MLRLAYVVAWLAGLMYLAFGVMFIVDPLGTMSMAGLTLTGDLAATELRAFYGGLEIALGLLICIFASRRQRLADALLLSTISYGGIGSARLVGIAMAGSTTPFLTFALCIELGMALISILLHRSIAKAI